MKRKNLVKKVILALGALALLVSYTDVASASQTKVKVSTNNQFKLTCDYWDESGELTWGNQEFIGNFADAEGYESNNSRACGTTAKTKKYPYGDENYDNLPLGSSVVYDSCTGSTGKQKAVVGQSCSKKGKAKLCAVKWAGYCYKDEESASLYNADAEAAKFSIAKSSITVNNTTKFKNVDACAYIDIANEDIISYDAEDNVVTALKSGSTKVRCYNNNDDVIRTINVTVNDKSNSKYRYVNVSTGMFAKKDGTGLFTPLNTCTKVTYLNKKIDGYCKIKYNGKTGYIFCPELSVSEPTECSMN